MKNTGILEKWNDDRGFGFIRHSESEMLFVHISAVQQMPHRPKEGDVLLYEIVQDSSGKKRAACVSIQGLQKIDRLTKSPTAKRSLKFKFKSIVFGCVAILAVLNYYFKFHSVGYVQYPTNGNSVLENFKNTDINSSDSHFSCQGKTYCSQMTSCEEARFYLKYCPNQATDGDRDGEPCEGQWCN